MSVRVGTSAFEVHGDRDSIATCLANARAADAVIIVLSQRYGRPIGGEYGDYSATHLEYREACAHGRRVFFYVRDRLDAEYDSWHKARAADKKDPAGAPRHVSFPWSKDDGPRLCAFIEERRLLTQPDRDNWRDVFGSSLDVKQLITRDFKREVNAVALRRLIEAGKVPAFSYSVSDGNGYPTLHGVLWGKVAALDVRWQLGRGPWQWVGALKPGSGGVHAETRTTASPQTVNVRYRTEYGHEVEDTLVFEKRQGEAAVWGGMPQLRRTLLDPWYEIG